VTEVQFLASRVGTGSIVGAGRLCYLLERMSVTQVTALSFTSQASFPSALKKEKSYIKKKDSLELGEYFSFH
jgi:hypothetical protein